jgi:hypothetical protein
MSYTYTDKIRFAQTPNFDAFQRLRVSGPMTLFDSSHRYADNGLWVSSTAGTATVVFNQNQGLVDLNVGSASGDTIVRETTKVFSYQPGKSLLVMNTFVMEPAKTGLRQRVGYYGASNGIYFQLEGLTAAFVERSLVTGSITETRISQFGGVYGPSDTGWNYDKLDGTGPSGITLDLTQAQILWMDVEWLGVGTVRVGFVINGELILCHRFNHANIISSTYITTASLPLRYEITNTGATSSSSTLKQICSTVISEGGYELRGVQKAVGTPITAAYALTTAGTFYPVVSIRLKASPNRLDAIVILTALSIMGASTGNFNWRVTVGGTTSGGTWVSGGADSAVEYNISGTSISGSGLRVLASGYFSQGNQAGTTVDILKEALFKFQLDRNGLTNTPYELTLEVTAGTNTETVFGSMDWEEISR